MILAREKEQAIGAGSNKARVRDLIFADKHKRLKMFYFWVPLQN